MAASDHRCGSHARPCYGRPLTESPARSTQVNDPHMILLGHHWLSPTPVSTSNRCLAAHQRNWPKGDAPSSCSVRWRCILSQCAWLVLQNSALIRPRCLVNHRSRLRRLLIATVIFVLHRRKSQSATRRPNGIRLRRPKADGGRRSLGKRRSGRAGSVRLRWWSFSTAPLLLHGAKRFRRAIWRALAYSICGTVVGTTSRSFLRNGWTKARDPFRPRISARVMGICGGTRHQGVCRRVAILQRATVGNMFSSYRRMIWSLCISRAWNRSLGDCQRASSQCKCSNCSH